MDVLTVSTHLWVRGKRLTSPQTMIYQSLLLTSLSETYMLAGRTDAAIQRAREALSMSYARGERGVQPHTLRLLGEITSHDDELDAGHPEVYYQDASTLPQDLACGPLLPTATSASASSTRGRAGASSAFPEFPSVINSS